MWFDQFLGCKLSYLYALYLYLSVIDYKVLLDEEDIENLLLVWLLTGG